MDHLWYWKCWWWHWKPSCRSARNPTNLILTRWEFKNSPCLTYLASLVNHGRLRFLGQAMNRGGLSFPVVLVQFPGVMMVGYSLLVTFFNFNQTLKGSLVGWWWGWATPTMLLVTWIYIIKCFFDPKKWIVVFRFIFGRLISLRSAMGMLESKIVPFNEYDWRRECQTNPSGWTEAAFFEKVDQRNSERDDLEKVPQLEGTPWSTLSS